jgi:hypothetical protein
VFFGGKRKKKATAVELAANCVEPSYFPSPIARVRGLRAKSPLIGWLRMQANELMLLDR